MGPTDLPELIRPAVQLYGFDRVQRESLSALGFPALMVTEFSEVRKLAESLGRTQ